MPATTKRTLVKRIADKTRRQQGVVRDIVQMFLDEVIEELGKGNRLEFRDFGIFQIVIKKPRRARNPRTNDPVMVPRKAAVHFKAGRRMKQKIGSIPLEEFEALSAASKKASKSTAGAFVSKPDSARD